MSSRSPKKLHSGSGNYNPGIWLTDVSLRGPRYHENSHAHHTCDSSSRQAACFKPGGAFRVASIHIARSTLRLASGREGTRDWGHTLILWKGVGSRRRFGGGLVSPHIPKLAHYSHVQSHAAISKIVCVIPTPSPRRRRQSQLAGIDPAAAGRDRRLLGSPMTNSNQ
jgi:hypothetical protein